ncbi:hypothetical protein Tco_0715561 [Tanacetum coccineum]
MSTHSGPSPTAPTSVVRNTVVREKEISQGNLNGTASDAAPREYCDKHYNQLLPIIAEKMHQKKVQQEKLKVVKAHLNFEEVSQHSESGTPSRGRDLRKRLGSKHICIVSGSPEPRRGRSKSPRNRGSERETVFKRLEKAEEKLKAVTRAPAKKEQNMLLRNIMTKERPHIGRKHCQKVKTAQGALEVKLRRWNIGNVNIVPHVQLYTHWFRQGSGRNPPYKAERRGVHGRFHAKGRSGSIQPITKESTSNVETTRTWEKTKLRRKGDFWNQQRFEQRRDKFTLLTKSLREILALDKGKFKAPPPMTTLVEKRNASKFYEKAVTFNQRIKVEQWERPGKGSKKGGNLRKGQAAGNLDGVAMTEDSKAKDHPNFLSRFNDLIPIPRGGGWDGGFRPEVERQMVLTATLLVGFSREIIWPLGRISLLVKIGDEEHLTSAWMNFMVVRSPSLYNGIIGRPGVRRIQAVSSTAYKMLKFPVPGGTVTLRSSRIILLECTMVYGPRIQQPVINQVTEEKIKVAIHPEYPEQTIAIGSTLTEEGRAELCGLLRRNLDIFGWKPADMTGVSRHIAEHRLNIREGCLPVRQNKRGQAPE